MSRELLQRSIEAIASLRKQVDPVERKAQQAFENTRNGMGFTSPNWNQLAEQTKQIYRDFVSIDNRPGGLRRG